MKESQKFAVLLAVFLLIYYAPLNSIPMQGPVMEGFHMLQEYARSTCCCALCRRFYKQARILYLKISYSIWVRAPTSTLLISLLSIRRNSRRVFMHDTSAFYGDL